MGFKARFPSICKACNKPINVCDDIRWSRRGTKQYVHTACYKQDNAQSASTAATATESGEAAATSTNNTSGENSSYKEESSSNSESSSQQESQQSDKQTDKQTDKKSDKQSNKSATEEKASEDDGMRKLAKMIEPHLDIVQQAESIIDSKIKELAATVRPSVVVEIKQYEKPTVTVDNCHPLFATLLSLIALRRHVYLYGLPGSGKTTAAHQAANSLKWEYGYISLNPQTPDSRLLGYMDGHGIYRESIAYRLYKNGGIFCIDELDNASPSLITTLNGMLENGRFSFPNGEMVNRHENFVVIATGNTNMRGASIQFPERRAQDAATMERFMFLEWPYDENFERSLALGYYDKADSWVTWIQQIRAFCAVNYPQLIVSPRASILGAEMLRAKSQGAGFSLEMIVESILFRGYDKDSVKAIMRANPIKAVVKC